MPGWAPALPSCHLYDPGKRQPIAGLTAFVQGDARALIAQGRTASRTGREGAAARRGEHAAPLPSCPV